MSIPAIQVNTTATCPHGLPPGACPICNGGGGSVRRADPPKKDEWSWEKCYSVGQLMRAQAEAKLESRQMFETQIAAMTLAQRAAQNVANFVQNTQIILANIEKNLPVQLQRAFSMLVKNVLMPLLNMLDKLPKIIGEVEKFLGDLRNKVINAMEKLNAIFGEMKAFIDQKFVKNFKKLARRFLRLFIFGSDDDGDGEGGMTKDEEEFAIFKSIELKKIKAYILKQTRRGDNDKHTVENSTK